jgi:hypothetical protein
MASLRTTTVHAQFNKRNGSIKKRKRNGSMWGPCGLCFFFIYSFYSTPNIFLNPSRPLSVTVPPPPKENVTSPIKIIKYCSALCFLSYLRLIINIFLIFIGYFYIVQNSKNLGLKSCTGKVSFARRVDVSSTWLPLG